MVMEKPEEETPDEEPGKEEAESIEPLDEIRMMVAKFAEGIETRLADSLAKYAVAVDARIDQNAAATNELTSKAKAALEALPSVIQGQVETQLTANLKGIIEEVGAKFEERLKALAAGGEPGADGAGGGLGLQQLLSHSDQIIGIVNAFRSPTTEQAMMGQMNFVMKWHSILSKLEKGGGSGDDFTKAIADTFTQQPQE